MAAPLLVVQLGHCYRTRGSTGTNGEQQHVAKVGAELVRRDTDHGLRAQLVLADDSNLPRGDVFVALHCDGSVHSSARGASVGYRNSAGRDVAHAWKRMHARYGFPGGFRPDNYTAALSGYYGTGWAAADGIPRAFVLELGFLTNPADRAWLTQPRNVVRQAEAILRAVAVSLGVKPPPAASSTSPKGRPAMDTIKRGDSGNSVALIQRCINEELKASGRDDPRVKVDGDYGPKTEAAVERYQRRLGGVKPTGAVDGLLAAFLFRYDPSVRNA